MLTHTFLQSIDLIHPEMANVAKADIAAKLGKTLKVKEECISIFGMKTKFGGGRSTGFAIVYDSADARKKYDTKTSLRRVSCKFHSKRFISNYGTLTVCSFLFVSSKFKN